MARTYYNIEEVLAKLGCTEEQLKGMVREGKLREFRDAGKLNYRVEEVDKLAAQTGQGPPGPEDSGSLAMADSGEIPLAPLEPEEGPQTKQPAAGGPPELGGSDAPIDLASDSGLLSPDGGSDEFKLTDSGTGTGALKLEDSGEGTGGPGLEDSGGGSSEIKLEDSGGEPAGLTPDDSGSGTGTGADIVSLDEVDKDAVEGMKKDDTVITNIGISVFDDDDLEIAADPMAKTLMTGGGEEHLGLDGSGGGSGLLDLTRESDDTSLGAELLEGIDMGDTAEAVAEPTPEPAGPGEEQAEALPEPEMAPAAAIPMSLAAPELASPAFTGLLIAGTLALALTGAMAVATSLEAWPAYLATLSEQFWILLAAGLATGGLFALAGWLVGRQSSRPRSTKRPKDEKKKGGGGPGAAGPTVTG